LKKLVAPFVALPRNSVPQKCINICFTYRKASDFGIPYFRRNSLNRQRFLGGNQWQPSQGAFCVVNVATVALFWYDKHQAPAADLADFGTSSMMGIGAEIINGRSNLVEDRPDD
jgi:hypothetical protein